MLGQLSRQLRWRTGILALALIGTVVISVWRPVLVPSPEPMSAQPPAPGPSTTPHWSATATPDPATIGPSVPATATASPRAGDPVASRTARATAAAAAAAGTGAGAVPFEQSTPASRDDFSGTALNTSQWGQYDSTAANGSSWSASMDPVGGGELQIVGVGTNPSGAGNVSGGVCWCRGSQARAYGVWQLRARFDAGSGYAPVIGLWPSQGDANSEGWFTLAYVSQPARTTSQFVLRGSGSASIDGSTDGNLTAWHTYTLEWRPAYVKIYLDSTVILDSTRSSTKVTIPTTPMYLYIQQNVGPDGSVPAPNGSTPAQVITHIDWVKYFN